MLCAASSEIMSVKNVLRTEDISLASKKFVSLVKPEASAMMMVDGDGSRGSESGFLGIFESNSRGRNASRGATVSLIDDSEDVETHSSGKLGSESIWILGFWR